MPNLTTNYMKFKNTQDARKVWEGMQVDLPEYTEGDDGSNYPTGKYYKNFSFESVIPSPKTKDECPDYAIIKQNETGIGVQESSDRPWFNWYSWNIQNWGTKWDAIDAGFSDEEIIFSTAWDSPSMELFQKIADKFEIGFILQINDEDGGWRGEDYIFMPNEVMKAESSPWQISENEEMELESQMEDILWNLEDEFPEPDENDIKVAKDTWERCVESDSLDDYPNLFAEQRKNIDDEDELKRRIYSFIKCCEEDENWKIMKALITDNSDLFDLDEYDEYDDEDDSQISLEDTSFCFTGALNTMKRKEAEEMVEDAGGTVKSSITKDLDYLVTNDKESGSVKNKKAQELGITIINEEEFLNLFSRDD